MLLEGQQFTQYHLVKRLKSGSRGEIYLAADKHRHHVAIKVIQTDYSLYPDDTAEEAVQLFLREMQAVAQIEHPHILPVYDSGEEYNDGITLIYTVMPFHEEGSLADWLHKSGQSKVLWPDEVEHIVKQAASVLQCVHNKNVIHGNIKPSNFLICNQAEKPNELKLQLVDFGVAKFMTMSNESKTIRGTPIYMAPEQWQGQLCPETDQYALAVIAYKLLTGCPPFINGNHGHKLHRHIQAKPPSTINPQISEELDAVLLRALSKKPQNRYRSMAAFAQAFRRALDNSHNIISINPTEEADGLENSPKVVPKVLVPRANNIVPLQSRKKSGPFIKDPRGRSILLSSLLFFLLFLFLLFRGIGIISYQNKGQAVTDNVNEANAATLGSRFTSTHTTTPRFHSTGIPPSYATATTYASQVANGGPIIEDPLQDNSQNYDWDTRGIQGGGVCSFSGGAYHASMPQIGYISACFAQATSFSNFSYQIQMTIVKGDQGGIAFRADPSKGSFYYFHISTSGDYALETYSSYNPSRPQPLVQGRSPAIKTGLNQANLIAVVANGSSLKFFVNMQQITSVSDGTYNGGKIGVVAEDISNPTEVVFRNVVVWPL